MPATFTHPLAILPLRGYCPRWLDFAALVIGSMSPDFGYYLLQFRVATFAHTFPGTLFVCLPTGLLVLALFHALRRPFCYILPQPHRGALLPLTTDPPALSFTLLVRTGISILLGSWTHTVWDSFTHRTGWSVEHLPFLRDSLVRIGLTVFPVPYLLQQGSTVVGSAGLLFIYGRWLRVQRAAAPAESESLSERHRYAILAGLLLVALAVAVPAASRVAAHAGGFFAFRLFVFRAAICTAAIYFPLVAVASLLLYARRPTAQQFRPASPQACDSD